MKKLFAILLISTLMAAPAFSQKAAYRYKSGKEYKYEIELKSDDVQEAGGQSGSSSTEMTMSVSFTISKVLDNGNMQGTAKIENALFLTESDQGSKSSGSEAAGKSLTFTLNGRGEMIDRDTSMKDQNMESVQVFEQFSHILPRFDGEKLADGAKWEAKDIDTTILGDADNMKIDKYTMKFSVVGKEKKNGIDCYKIEYIKDSDIKGKMARGNNEVNITAQKHLKGFFYHAIEEGILVEFEATNDVDQVWTASGSTEKMTITSKTTFKTTLDTK